MTPAADDPLDEDAAVMAAYHGTLDLHLQALREEACAIATARYAGVDDTACQTVYAEHMADLPDQIVRDLVWWALWVGVRSVDGEARKRLIHLNNAGTVAALEGKT